MGGPRAPRLLPCLVSFSLAYTTSQRELNSSQQLQKETVQTSKARNDYYVCLEHLESDNYNLGGNCSSENLEACKNVNEASELPVK